MTLLSQSQQVFGTTEAVASPRVLRAGDLSCELEEGSIRYVRWRGTEVIRGISYLLRDADWGTAPMAIQRCDVRQTLTSFDVVLEAVLGRGENAIAMRGNIVGSSDGSLEFRVLACADRAVRTSRCGFVVLHPADVAGKDLVVTHTDGTREHTSFPLLISPVQPVFDIRELRHSPREGLWVECQLHAELPNDVKGKFEMEDQRNWSDASFKTYVGSLLDPWPYTLPAGSALSQAVLIRLQDRAPLPHPIAFQSSRRCQLKIGNSLDAFMPAIGVAAPAGIELASEAEKAAIRMVRPQWLLGEINLTSDTPSSQTDAERQLHAVFGLARSFDARVQLDFICGDSPEEDAARAAELCTLTEYLPDAFRCLPSALLKSFQPQGLWPKLPPLMSYSAAFRRAFPEGLVGGGMFTNFTELNRNRPAPAGLDFIGHSVCPIVHAADDRSVMESIEALSHIVNTVHALWPGVNYRLGPVSLAMHRNPYGNQPLRNTDRKRRPMADDDPRHQGSFGSAWLASVAAAAIPLGVEVLYLNHTHGPSGPLLRNRRGDLKDETCVPACGVQSALAKAAGAPVHEITGLPVGLSGLAWYPDGGAPHVLIANRTGESHYLDWIGFVAQDLSTPLRQGDVPAAVPGDQLEITPFACWLLRQIA